ncbi:hypothetical protein [Vulcaniibacterium gelatinicum]|uniref:hypothetical protein n=1 Tax=Vulcaniibacterium gelatinicum TaxID=2598725 RepID=UPI0011C960DF|nr:hypothetical protein [Vulcaniibacterium gelatinicum]
MIRTLIPPVAVAALLAGCVTTADYRYYQGRGDYYYGQPAVEYREHYYGHPWSFYGHYGYPRAGWQLGFRYGYPYYPYYGWFPYYGYPYYWHPYPYVHRRPVKPGESTVDPTPDRPRSPWRDLEHLRRRSEMREDAQHGMPGEPPLRSGDPRLGDPGGGEGPRRPREWTGEVRPRLAEPGPPPARSAPRWHESERPAPQPAMRRVQERDEEHTP